MYITRDKPINEPGRYDWICFWKHGITCKLRPDGFWVGNDRMLSCAIVFKITDFKKQFPNFKLPRRGSIQKVNKRKFYREYGKK